MFKNNFDILKVSERCYQLHCAGKMFKIEFDENDNKQSMFDYLLNSSEGYSKIVMQFKKKYPFNEILDFFFLLKQNGFLYYNDEDSLSEGKLYDSKFKSDEDFKQKRIGVVITKNNKIAYDIINASELVKSKLSILRYDKDTKRSEIVDFVAKNDFVIVDKTSYNPIFMRRYNDIAMSQNKPWLLISCFRAVRGYVGPLFWGEKTGCYSCFEKRVKSNFLNFKELSLYEDWLGESKNNSHIGNISTSDYTLIYNIAIIECKKFLMDYGFPHTYKQLYEINFDDLTSKWHHFYKVPFCPQCSTKMDNACAPWLDPITLEIL